MINDNLFTNFLLQLIALWHCRLINEVTKFNYSEQSSGSNFCISVLAFTVLKPIRSTTDDDMYKI